MRTDLTPRQVQMSEEPDCNHDKAIWTPFEVGAGANSTLDSLLFLIRSYPLKNCDAH